MYRAPPRKQVPTDVHDTWWELAEQLTQHIAEHEMGDENMTQEFLESYINDLMEPMNRWTISALHDLKRDLLTKKQMTLDKAQEQVERKAERAAAHEKAQAERAAKKDSLATMDALGKAQQTAAHKKQEAKPKTKKAVVQAKAKAKAKKAVSQAKAKGKQRVKTTTMKSPKAKPFGKKRVKKTTWIVL